MEGRKYVCKYCSKRFPCGKSLGGHIRTHMTGERSNVDGGMFIKLDGVSKKRDLWCEDDAGNSIYGLRENPKKTMRFVHSGGANYEQEERFCKECGKGFPSLKALCGHMACHSEKEKRTIRCEDSEKKLKLVMDSQSDTDTCAPSHPRRSKRMKVKTINLSNHPFSSSPPSSVVPLANGSSPVSEVEQEQEEVARCLMLLSRDSSFKGRFASVTESSDNNSIILEAKSSSLDTRIGVSNGNNNFVSNNAYDLAEKKLLQVKDIKLKSAEFGASDNSGSRGFKYGPKTKMVDSYVSNDEFKGVKLGDKSRFFEDYDVESWKIVNRGRSKYTSTVAKKLVMEDLDYDRTDGTTRKFDSRKISSYDSLGRHNLVGVPSKKIANGFANEVYENGTKGWKYECLEGEMDYGSYDSTEESYENSSETESFPALRSHNSKALNGKKSNKAKKKLKSKKSREYECPICYKIFRSGQALGGHKRSHFIGGSEENTVVIKQVAPVVPCLIDLNLPAPVDE
ncbi:Zinc finger protein ZAT1 [Spatholobus suberectus]|nr:Zinc finger protein ZAT1 [Spatholobus suberectus]